jgi:hypothetical protein
MKYLSETIELMNSENYDDRLKAEYEQLEIRTQGLAKMLVGYRDGTLSFTPKCSYDMLNGQLKAMQLYSEYLQDRAETEGIDLYSL